MAPLPAGYPDGSAPELAQLDWLPAEVPGAVQYDLVRAGKIANPFFSSEAAREAGWVAETDWCYRTHFRLDDIPLGLCLEVLGVDTFGELWLNGTHIGSVANNYRQYRFPIHAAARNGDNLLVVRVKAHRRMLADRLAEARSRLATTSNQVSYRGKSLMRRYQRSFLSGNSSLLNLGAEILGIGINRPVAVVDIPTTRIERFHFSVESASDAGAQVRLSAEVASDPIVGEAVLEATLLDPSGGHNVATATAQVANGKAETVLNIANPRLWWPRGYGEPFRYRLVLKILANSTVAAEEEHLVGIRKVRLLTQLASGRATFQFVVNDVPVYVRGHNLVPLDYVKVHGSPADYQRVIHLITASNANLVRLWGGGASEPDEFYDALDAAGVMLWQDFYLHSTTYPDYDAAFVEEFRRESFELLWRLRNHPCLVLLCGGNEQDEGWEEWGWQGDLDRFYGSELAHDVAAGAAHAAVPELPFVPNSPHGRHRAQSPVDGDMHCWGNFYNATKDPTFVTETCWNLESYSSAATLRETMGLDVDKFRDLGWPQRWKELTGLSLVTKLPYSGCNASRTLRQYLGSLEVEQLVADQQALSVLRFRSPSCRGIVYWPLNKGAPLFEFGCVDYALRPMMTFYGIKRAFADTAVSVYREGSDVCVVGSNLTLHEVSGVLHVLHVDATGKVLGEEQRTVTLPSDWCGGIFELPRLYEKVVDRTRELVEATFVSADQSLYVADTLYFCPLAEFQVDNPALDVNVLVAADKWVIDIAASCVVKLLQLEGDGLLFSDNCFSLLPRQARRIDVQLLDPDGHDRTVKISAMGTETTEQVVLN